MMQPSITYLDRIRHLVRTLGDETEGSRDQLPILHQIADAAIHATVAISTERPLPRP